MKKILFIINRLGGGGAERVLVTLANQLATEKNKVKILVYNKSDRQYDINDDIEIEQVCDEYIKNRCLNKVKRILKIRKKIKEYKPEDIITFEYFVNMQVIIANAFLKNRIIISERNDPAKTGNGRITKRIRNILYKHADCLVCQTEEAKEYFPRKVQERTVIIPNPIMPNLPKRYEGIRKKEIVTFCRIEKQKNLIMLIDAFEMLVKEFPEYKLSIYGEGSEKEHLKEYIEKEKAKDKITLYDFAEDIHNKIIDCAMYVSSSNYEGISNSMIEAMGIGLPTICTDCPCGGARMMIENNVNGILVPVGDVNALYEAMKKVICDLEFAKKISKNAIEINKKLNQKKICKNWNELL